MGKVHMGIHRDSDSILCKLKQDKNQSFRLEQRDNYSWDEIQLSNMKKVSQSQPWYVSESFHNWQSHSWDKLICDMVKSDPPSSYSEELG